MKGSIRKVLLMIVIAVCICSCKPVNTIQDPAGRVMPAAYQDGTDTINSATLSWKQFFGDKHLVDLIDSAITNNWDMQIALQRIKAAQANVLFRKGMLNPSVSAGAAASLRRFGLYTMDGAGNISTEIQPNKIVPVDLPDYFMGLQTSWEVDLWGKLKNRKKAAIARFLATVEGKNLLTTNLISAVARDYYELLALDQNLKVLDETIAIQEKANELVQIQKEAAVANELAVKQFEAQLLDLRALRLNILQLISETENNINLLTGRYPQPVMRDTVFFSVSPAVIHTGVPAALLQNRPDIRQAEMEVAAAKADVLAAKAAFYPSLNITGSAGFQAFKTGLLFKTPESIAYGLLAGLSAPVINRTAIKAEFNYATASQLESLYNYQKTIVNGYVEVYNEILRAKNLQQVIEVRSKETEALIQSIDISEQLFRTGRATYIEVLFAQQNALKAKLDLNEAKKNQFLTTVNLYKALGGGWR